MQIQRKMPDEDLADLVDLLRVYCEIYPADSEAEQFRLHTMERFTAQTGNTDTHKYLINRRKAGRKPRITDEQRQTIKRLHGSGVKIQAIAELTGVSVGAVHYILYPVSRR